MSGAPLPWWILPAVIGTNYATLFIAESLVPLRRRVEGRMRHIVRNFTMGGVSLATMTILQTPILVPFAQLIEKRQIGLVHWLEIPRPWSIILAILVLDSTLWIWHSANHRVPSLWALHLAHHVDRDLDTSTASRFHFAELTMSIPFRVLQIASPAPNRLPSRPGRRFSSPRSSSITPTYACPASSRRSSSGSS